MLNNDIHCLLKLTEFLIPRVGRLILADQVIYIQFPNSHSGFYPGNKTIVEMAQ